MTVQNKITALMLSIVVLMSLALYTMNNLDHKRFTYIRRNRANEKLQLLNHAIELKQKSLELFVYDYSYWDDMYEFTKTQKIEWAKQNIDAVLTSFNLQGVWIYGNKGELIYSISRLDYPLKYLPVKKETFDIFFQQNHFSHFFVWTKDGLLEIRGAPIQPSADNKRVTEPAGVFFAGRLWSDNYLSEFSALLNSNVELTIDETSQPATYDTLTYIQVSSTLKGWDGQSIARIISTNKSEMMTEIIRLSNFQYWILVGFSVLIMLPLYFLLSRWVSRPLQNISTVLAQEKTDSLNNLINQTNEFGNISRLIKYSFEQKQNLQEEIVRRKSVENVLQQSEKDYRNLFENAGNAITIIGVGTMNILAVNHRACEIYGYTQDELFNAPFVKLWSQSAEMESLRNKVLESIHAISLESVHRKKDGTSILFDINARQIEYRAVQAILCIHHDISQRKLIEEFSLSHNILNQVGNLVIVSNEKAEIIYVNRALVKTLGYHPREVLGDLWWHVTRETSEAAIAEKENIKKIVKGEMPVSATSYERWIRHKNGSLRCISWHDALTSDHLLIGVGHDVTERVIAELELIESEKRYRLLFESIATATFIYNTDTKAFLAVNKASLDLYGYSREEFLSMKLNDLMTYDYTGPESEHEMHVGRHQLKSGRIIEVELMRYELVFDHHKACLVLVSDLSEKRKIELAEIKLRNQKIRLASVISAIEEERRRISKELHDGIGQLLSAIRRNMELSEKSRNESDEMHLTEQNKILLDNALVETKLIAYNLMPRVLEDFGLYTAIESLLRQMFSKNEVKIDFQIFNLDKRLSHPIELGVYRVIQEALNNIVKHSKATEVSFQMVGHSSSVVITIEDNGQGFSLREVKRRETRGMGLVSMRERIEFLNGKFHIDSSIGHGTSLVMEIPIPTEEVNE
ncbi:PAS domain S-box protein [bacterium]|nr:PAS domain S-box protein [bacterium]